MVFLGTSPPPRNFHELSLYNSATKRTSFNLATADSGGENHVFLVDPEQEVAYPIEAISLGQKASIFRGAVIDGYSLEALVMNEHDKLYDGDKDLSGLQFDVYDRFEKS